MSVIHNERRILREAYTHLDEALEYLNSELNKEEQAHSNTLHRLYQETKDLQDLADALDRPPDNAIQRLPSLKNEITVLLAGIYELVNAMRQLHAKVEDCVELTRQAQIDYHTSLITGEGDVRNIHYDRNRPHKGQGRRTRSRPMEGRREAPGLPLVDIDPGDLRQGQDLASLEQDGSGSH